MKDRVPNQEKVFKVLLENKDGNNCVDDPVSLCTGKLPQFKKERIPELLRLLEKRCAITIFRRGVVTNNGGVICKVKILRKEFPADRRALIRW